MKRFNRCQAGFTLVELVAIIVILGILVVASSRWFDRADYGLRTTRDAIIAAVSHAQQIAMARDSGSNPVTLAVAATAVSVQESGVAVTSPGAEYPFNLPDGVSVTSGVGTLHFDKLGRTSATTLALNGGAATITVEASGYAY